MFTSLFTGWFARSRSRRPPAALQVEVCRTADGTVIRVKGDARAECAGALLGGLLAPAERRPAVVTVDLSELRSISTLAVGVLAGYRRCVARAGGQVRLTGALRPAVRASLARAELIQAGADTTGAGAPGGAGP